MLPVARDTTQRKELCERILDQFQLRAGPAGVRAVIMSELASALGVSTKTIYREFANKGEIVAALLERWADRFATMVNESPAVTDPLERLRLTITIAANAVWAFDSQFWNEVSTDYPEAFEHYRLIVEGISANELANAMQSLRPDIPPDFAAHMFQSMVWAAAHREEGRRVRTHLGGGPEAIEHDVEMSIDLAVEIFSSGALARPGLRVVGERDDNCETSITQPETISGLGPSNGQGEPIGFRGLSVVADEPTEPEYD